MSLSKLDMTAKGCRLPYGELPPPPIQYPIMWHTSPEELAAHELSDTESQSTILEHEDNPEYDSDFDGEVLQEQLTALHKELQAIALLFQTTGLPSKWTGRDPNPSSFTSYQYIRAYRNSKQALFECSEIVTSSRDIPNDLRDNSDDETMELNDVVKLLCKNKSKTMENQIYIQSHHTQAQIQGHIRAALQNFEHAAFLARQVRGLITDKEEVRLLRKLGVAQSKMWAILRKVEKLLKDPRSDKARYLRRTKSSDEHRWIRQRNGASRFVIPTELEAKAQRARKFRVTKWKAPERTNLRWERRQGVLQSYRVLWKD